MGDAACAVTVYRNKQRIGQFVRGLGKRTNNEAEYEAILLGLLVCWAGDLQDPVIYSDSLLAVNQITGRWECHAEALVPLLMSVQEIQDEFRFRLVHVPRLEVGDADLLVNEFLDHYRQTIGRRPKRKKV